MRLLKIAFLGLIVFAIGFIFFLLNGQVIFFIAQYRIDLSFRLFVILLVTAYFFVYGAITWMNFLIGLPQRAQKFQKERKKQIAYESLHVALRFFYDGRFWKVKKSVDAISHIPALQSSAYLLAANAAHQLGQFVERDRYLELTKHPKETHHAVLVASANFSISDHQFEQAIEYLEQAKKIGGRHIYALQLELKARQRLGEWAQVLNLINLLKKHQVLFPLIEERYTEQAYLEMLKGIATEASLLSLWKKIPIKYQVTPSIAARAAQRCIAFENYPKARGILAPAIALAPHSFELLTIYIQLKADVTSLDQYLAECEAWLVNTPSSIALLYVIGELCRSQRIWGKARQYLERALRLTGEQSEYSKQLHIILAKLFEQQHQFQPDNTSFAELTLKHYRAAALC